MTYKPALLSLPANERQILNPPGHYGLNFGYKDIKSLTSVAFVAKGYDSSVQSSSSSSSALSVQWLSRAISIKATESPNI